MMLPILLAFAVHGSGGLQQDQTVDLRRYHLSNTKLTAAEGTLRVEFLPAEWPGIRFDTETIWDWSGAGGLALDVRNPGSDTVQFNVRIDDDVKADGITHCRTGSASLSPGASGRFVVPLGINPMDVGMRGLPPIGGGLKSLGAYGSGPFDLKHIVGFLVFLHSPAKPQSLVVSNVRLVTGGSSLDGIVDAWGQFARADWPGKVHADADLPLRKLLESRDLAAHPTLPGFDKFGGWADGPTLTATGYFRTEKVKGKWWLVTPEGKLFFSMGMDCIGDQGATIVTGREKMFAALPAKDGPFGRFYGFANVIHSGPVKQGDTYNFLGANLSKKYGEGYGKQWLDLALDRLRAWGFNTVGNWSDHALYGNGRVPYVATAGVDGKHARVPSGQDYWGQMHDPFDPQFALEVKSSLQAVPLRSRDDPWCVGWFVDNEISWGSGNDNRGRYGLALGALGLDAAASPAKRELVAELKAKYKGVDALAAAWNVPVASWATLEAPFRLTGAINDTCWADLAAFSRRFAETYFRTIRDEMKRIAPHHLYLGCRFAWYTPEAAQAAAQYCDVVSFNFYLPKLDADRSAFCASLNKPCIIGEFHFGALDRGMFHPGLVSTANQKERSETYVQFVRSVLDDPSFVGCHWFQYTDEPLTGRTYDGENYNIGFVSMTDTPYPEMVAAAKAVHGAAYTRRAH